MTDTVWVGTIDAEISDPMIILATTRDICRQRVERTIRREDDYVKEWVVDWAEGTSELALRESGMAAIISKQKVHDQCDTEPVDLDEAMKARISNDE